jgi:hypothetical protein
MNINPWDIVLLDDSSYRMITHIDTLSWYSIDKEWNTIWWTKWLTWININKYGLHDHTRTFVSEFIYPNRIDFVIPTQFVSMFKVKNFTN